MAERIKLVVPFNYDENWIGGVYYIKNLITSLTLLPDEQRPHVILATVSAESYRFITSSTLYPYLSWVTQEQILALRGTLDVDVVFPYMIPSLEKKTLTWIPDFQDKHLPEFFNKDDLEGRTAYHESCFKAAGVVFSSQSVLRDFHRFYPKRAVTPYVVKFAAFNEPVGMPTDDFYVRQNVPRKYYYAPNQFWIHKNQGVVLEALRLLKKHGCEPFVCFSGKEHDPRAPGYSAELRRKISDYGLDKQIAMLGFMPRADQLAVINGSHAIIQPSLFEGWSTVVEDAKAANKFVIASDLAVHREQLAKNGDFFLPKDAEGLAKLMQKHWEDDPEIKLLDYENNQRQFANDFMGAIKAVMDASKAKVSSAAKPDVNFLQARYDSRLLALQTANNLLAAGQGRTADDRQVVQGVRVGTNYSGGEEVARHLALVGFSEPENTGIWTTAREGVAEFVVSEGLKNLKAKLNISISAFNPTMEERWVEVGVEGGGVQRRRVEEWEDFEFSLNIPESVDIFFRVRFATNFLVAAGISDTRKVGLFIRKFSVIT